MPPASDEESIETLEAFADTIVPGEKRHSGDRAVAGVVSGAGAVAAGALELLHWDATGVTGWLPDFVKSSNEHAERYAAEHGLEMEADVPAFVALPFEHRTRLIQQLTTPGHPEKQFWVMLALFCNMAFDSAAHLNTVEAMAAGHPGLAAMGIRRPDADGLWRAPQFSYGRKLADLHPATTPSGSPA